MMDDEEIYVSTIQALIMYNINNNNNNTYKNLKIDGYSFKLRVLIGSHYTSGVK